MLAHSKYKSSMLSMNKLNPNNTNTLDSRIALEEAPATTLTAVPATIVAPVSDETPAHQARALLKRLQTQFPAFRDCLPLAIGIDKQLNAELPEISRKV